MTALLPLLPFVFFLDFESFLVIYFLLDIETVYAFAERTAPDLSGETLAVVLHTARLVAGAAAGVEHEVLLSNRLEFGLESERIHQLQLIDDLLTNRQKALVIEAVEAFAVSATKRALLEALAVELQTLGLLAAAGELLFGFLHYLLFRG